MAGRQRADLIVPALVDVLRELRRDSGLSRTNLSLREVGEIFIRYPDVESIAFDKWERTRKEY